MTFWLLWRGSRLTGSEHGLVGYWPGDLGIALDFSPTRNTVRTSGVMITTSAPALTVPSGELVTLLFAGKYQSATKWGGTTGIWRDSSLIYLTSTNYFVIGDSVVHNPNIQGNTISWDWEVILPGVALPSPWAALVGIFGQMVMSLITSFKVGSTLILHIQS